VNAREASTRAACLEFELGATSDSVRVEVHALPARATAHLRGSRWVFIVRTGRCERAVRETLAAWQVRHLGETDGLNVFAAWPGASRSRG
jgi:hypothetical protein